MRCGSEHEVFSSWRLCVFCAGVCGVLKLAFFFAVVCVLRNGQLKFFCGVVGVLCVKCFHVLSVGCVCVCVCVCVMVSYGIGQLENLCSVFGGWIILRLGDVSVRICVANVVCLMQD